MSPRTLNAKEHDLGGLIVHRVLPQAPRRSVGPFVFLDHMGPHTTAPGTGFDVRPHPHIGLATLTYLYQGEQMHRDSMGVVARIVPGDVNVMIAGRGVAHSERATPEGRRDGMTMHGLQFWLALPRDHEDDEPSFQHADAAELPAWSEAGATVRVVLGSVAPGADRAGHVSPIRFPSRALLLDVSLEAGGAITLAGDEAELGVYVASGAVTLAGGVLPSHRIALIDRDAVRIEATEPSRLAIFGGDALDAPRQMFWNFVASDAARIRAASERWKARDWPRIPGDDEEFIPLPDVGHP